MEENMSDFLIIIFFLVISVCIIAVGCFQRRQEAIANADLRDYRRAQAQRRARLRQQMQSREESSGQPREDPEEKRKERERVVKAALNRRTLEHGADSIASLRQSMRSTARQEELNESKRGSIIARSWHAASQSVRVLTDALTRDEGTCAICFEKYEKGDTVAWAKKHECNHIFHEDCISPWLHKHDECPLCRRNIIEEFDADTDADEEEGQERTATNEREGNTNENEGSSVNEDDRNDGNERERNSVNEDGGDANNEREAEVATNEENV